jgi:AraC-like DNA-binding protein
MASQTQQAALENLARKLGDLVECEQQTRATASQTADRGYREEFKTRVTNLVCAALIVRQLSPPAFLTCARTIREAMLGEQVDIARFLEDVERIASEQKWRPRHPKVEKAVRSLCAKARRECEERLATEVGLSPSHLGRLLRSETGCSFRRWRQAVVMLAGIRRLCESDEQIAQIAYGLGYEHPTQFSREFRDTFGTSPREFRRVCHLDCEQ